MNDTHQSLTTPATGDALSLPETLWRLGLGALVGQVWLLISTTGYKSGQVRRALSPYFFANGKKYVYADPDAPWYQNALQDPYCTIQSAYGTEPVKMERVTDQGELTAVIANLMHNRPTFAEQIFRKYNVQSVPEDLIALGDRLPLVTFSPTTEATPPAVETDMLWLPPAILIGLILGWRMGRGRR